MLQLFCFFWAADNEKRHPSGEVTYSRYYAPFGGFVRYYSAKRAVYAWSDRWVYCRLQPVQESTQLLQKKKPKDWIRNPSVQITIAYRDSHIVLRQLMNEFLLIICALEATITPVLWTLFIQSYWANQKRKLGATWHQVVIPHAGETVQSCASVLLDHLH